MCSVVGDVLNELSAQEFASKLEPFIRRVVRIKEFEQNQHLFCSSFYQFYVLIMLDLEAGFLYVGVLMLSIC